MFVKTDPVLATVSVTLPDGFVVSRVEIADTSDLRIRGLSWRELVGPETGMLFVFDWVASHPMWTKQCLVPLDIVWLDVDGNVMRVATVYPGPEILRDLSQKSMYVLELGAGQAAAHGVVKGSRIRWDV